MNNPLHAEWLAAAVLSLVAPAPLEHVVTVIPAETECVSAASIGDAVTVWLSAESVDPRLAIEVALGTDSIGFRLLRDGEVRVERALAPPPQTCADQRAALGLSIAMAIDASVLGSLAPQAEGSAAPLPDPGSEVSPDPATDAGPKQTGPEPPTAAPVGGHVEAPVATAMGPLDRRMSVSLAASALGSVGVTPGAGFGGQLGLELGMAPWLDVRVGGLGVGGLPLQLGGGTVATGVAAAQLGVCPARAFGRVRPRLCVGVAAGALVAEGAGFGDSARAVLPWVAIESGADLDIRVHPRLALRIGARAVAPTIRTDLDVRNTDGNVVDVRAGSPLGVSAAFGLKVKIR